MDKYIKEMERLVEEKKTNLKSIIDVLRNGGGRMTKEEVEDAIEKYDEMLEDFEASFTKAKIDFGLRFEEQLKKYNQSRAEFDRKMYGMGSEFATWHQENRTRMLDLLKKGALGLNDLLGSGMDAFMKLSERGKDMIRSWNDKRSDDLSAEGSNRGAEFLQSSLLPQIEPIHSLGAFFKSFGFADPDTESYYSNGGDKLDDEMWRKSSSSSSSFSS